MRNDLLPLLNQIVSPNLSALPKLRINHYRPHRITIVDTFIAPYVIKFPFPTFGVTRLSESLDSVFDEPISHDTISTATTIMSCWLAQCQREFGRMSAPNAVPTAELPREIYRIWLAIDEIHNGTSPDQSATRLY
jgi:hypothetical protein